MFWEAHVIEWLHSYTYSGVSLTLISFYCVSVFPPYKNQTWTHLDEKLVCHFFVWPRWKGTLAECASAKTNEVQKH